MSKEEWLITPEHETNTYVLYDPDGKLWMRCWPQRDYAVALYLGDLHSQENVDRFSVIMTRMCTLVEAAKTHERLFGDGGR